MKLSIIIPVYREEKNIETTLSRIQKNVHTPHEILLIYHYKTDPTVEVIQKYKRKHKNQLIRLLQNADKSNNRVMKSIKLGFLHAKGDAIVVLMADLSDDITQIDSMYALFKKGYDVVCASRYMKGGKKIGGPIIKTLLSRLAGLTLHYFFHIPTHDSTNAFKLYNREIFNKITIESIGGFEYSLEIVLKAHKLGYKITEIPTTWKDRMEGSSNFKILSWIPEYVKWYTKAYVLMLPKKINYNWMIIPLLTLLAFASFWRVLYFGFFQDDAFFLWQGMYDPFFQFINFKHPGSPLEALFLVHIFGLNTALYQLFGIAIKVCTAYLTGLFLYKLTNSKLAGFLAALFFSASSAGMFVVNAFNYNLPGLVAICLLLSLLYLIQTIQEKKSQLWKFIFFLFLAVILDPARALPIFGVIPLCLFFIPNSKQKKIVKQFLVRFYFVFGLVCIPLLTVWYFFFDIGKGGVMEVFLKGMIKDPTHMIVKTKDAGNFFATIANMFSNVIYGLKPLLPKLETVNYERVFGFMGVGIFLTGFVSLILFFRKKSQFFFTIFFCIFWIGIFYLPNWISEPRVTMSAQMHYVFISSIGFVCLVAYLCSFITSKWILCAVSALFILLNVYKANTILIEQSPYRLVSLHYSAWNTILHTVPRNEENDIFFFTGDYNWLESSIAWDGGLHFLLLTKNSEKIKQPYFTADLPTVIQRVCTTTPEITIYKKTLIHPKVPLSHIYSWNVIKPGVLVDQSQEKREEIKALLEQKGC